MKDTCWASVNAICFFVSLPYVCSKNIPYQYPKNQHISNVPVVKQLTVISQINPEGTSHSKCCTSDGNVPYKIFTGIWDTFFQVRTVFLIHMKL